MKEIKSRLLEIENQENVQILYACESGSRAWGFPSEDSDYDVRFLYLRQKDWYLSVDVEEKPDVIERPISDELDISGWDLRKALKLLRKSNPPLLEWLNSPIVYLEKFTIADEIRKIVPEFYSPKASLYHYLHMAQGNFREYLRGDIVWVKKYFYVLRPLLAIRWIESKSEVVPMEFETLVEHSVDSPELKQAIENLLERKKQGQELDREPRIEIISEFVERELQRLETKLTEQNKPKPPTEKLNELFRNAIDEVEQFNQKRI
jgi:predicted nucleotidyltransferase